MPEVLFITHILTHYRLPFHQEVRKQLAAADINYRVMYSPPPIREGKKKDNVLLEWAEEVPASYPGKTSLCWQHVFGKLGRPDLVVLGQENSLLHNYLLQVWRPLGGPRLAFFGHGKNFQSRNPDGLAERFKRFWIDKVDWWFAYTPICAAVIAQSGFPRERITIFNNAIDTSSISAELASVDADEQQKLRQSLVGGSENVGVYVGGMYPDKRLDFLIEAAERIRDRVPDFHLLLIGAGEDAHIAEAAAQQHDWIHYLGPKFGKEKTALVALAKVFLMPGLVGLAVLDSFAYGTPMVTTDLPYHSPEIDYLEDGMNGVIVKEADSAEAYAAAVGNVLTDDEYRNLLQRGAEQALQTYTIQSMANRFAQGVVQALGK